MEMSEEEEAATVKEDMFRVPRVLVEEHRDTLGMLTMAMDSLLEEVKGMWEDNHVIALANVGHWQEEMELRRKEL